MAAGDTHYGTFAWGATTPVYAQDCTTSGGYGNLHALRGVSCQLAIQDADSNPQYTLIATGDAMADSTTLTGTSNFHFRSSGVSLISAATGTIVSEGGYLSIGGHLGSEVIGEFAIVGAGVFSLPQPFEANNESGTMQLNFIEQ